MSTLDGTPVDTVQIGTRLRRARRARRLTIAQVADATGLTKGFISKLERDETSPSVATLVSVCQYLAIPVGSLFDPPQVTTIAFHDAPFVSDVKHIVERQVTPRTEHRVQIRRAAIRTGAGSSDEVDDLQYAVKVIHVLEGKLDVTLPSGTVTLRRLDTMTLSGYEPHSWRNPGDVEAKIVVTCVPENYYGTRSPVREEVQVDHPESHALV